MTIADGEDQDEDQVVDDTSEEGNDNGYAMLCNYSGSDCGDTYDRNDKHMNRNV